MQVALLDPPGADLVHEVVPRPEAGLVGDGDLRVAQGEAGGLDRALGVPRVGGGDPGERVGHPPRHRPAQLLGAGAQLAEIGVGGQGFGHGVTSRARRNGGQVHSVLAGSEVRPGAQPDRTAAPPYRPSSHTVSPSTSSAVGCSPAFLATALDAW